MSDLYAPVQIRIPDGHPMFDGQGEASDDRASWIALDFATGRTYAVDFDPETGEIRSAEECLL
jgi:hypothetical protein